MDKKWLKGLLILIIILIIAIVALTIMTEDKIDSTQYTYNSTVVFNYNATHDLKDSIHILADVSIGEFQNTVEYRQEGDIIKTVNGDDGYIFRQNGEDVYYVIIEILRDGSEPVYVTVVFDNLAEAKLFISSFDLLDIIHDTSTSSGGEVDPITAKYGAPYSRSNLPGGVKADGSLATAEDMK